MDKVIEKHKSMKRILLLQVALLFTLVAKSQSAIDSLSTLLFSKVPPKHSNVHFANLPNTDNRLNTLTYYYYYNGGGVAVGDINNDGMPDIFLTGNNTKANKLYLNKGNLVFEDITIKAGVSGTADWSSGVTMADINADGYLDIYVSVVTDSFGLTGANQLFINNGNGTFTDKAEKYKLNIKGFTSQVAFFDYDNDEDLDCFILSQSTNASHRIRKVEERKIDHPFFKSRMLRNELNNGKELFVDVSEEAGIYQSDIGFGLGIAVADINNDGWEDIYITNDFYEDDYLYFNNGNGTFSERGKDVIDQFSMYSMGVDIADCNNDGQLDIITLDMLLEDEYSLKTTDIIKEYYLYEQTNIRNGFHRAYVKNCLQINDGSGKSFSERANLSNIADTDWSWAPLMADFDNDGNKDLIITAGIPLNTLDLDYINYLNSEYIARLDKAGFITLGDSLLLNKLKSANSRPFLFKGDGTGNFIDKSIEWGTSIFQGSSTNGVAYSDLDNDGDLDLVINRNLDTAIILRNNTNSSNFVKFNFRNNSNNTFAIGAKVFVYSGNTVQYQQLMPTRGFQSSVDPVLHFGLQKNKSIDSAVIVFPNQTCTTLFDLRINTNHVVDVSSVNRKYIHNNYFPSPQKEFTNISDTINIGWRHQENSILDYYVQQMLPQAKSARGPKVAVADVNGDNLQDLFVCGASGQAGQLFIQNTDGGFDATKLSAFKNDSLSEDVDAIFFDSDNDGDQDLFVVSGGNQFNIGSKHLQDRLYINNGKGVFNKIKGGLPPINFDKSSVDVVDIDNDGDMDLLIGNYLNPKMYGQPQTSYVLLNLGNNTFSLIDKYFEDVGMVTDVLFADMNNDDIKDIIMVGEWMPIKIYLVNAKGLTEMEVPNSTGLWQSVYADDVNGDGFNDLIVGNWGLNSRLASKKELPLKMYWGDFNNNSRSNQLLVYNRDGNQHSFLPKFLITPSLPKLNKKYIKWEDYANATLKEAFGEWIDTLKPLIAENLASVVCYGDGKGNFKMEALPLEFQKSPINVITKSKNKNEYLFGGNMFYCTPQEGQYDAQPLTLGKFSSSQINILPQQNLSLLKGSVKDLKWITIKGYGKVLIVAQNNKPLKFYKPIKR